MSLGVNNPVTFCGKNNEVHKALKKLEHEKIISNETIDKLVNESVEVAKRSSKAEQIETTLKAVLDTSFLERIAKILGEETVSVGFTPTKKLSHGVSIETSYFL